MRVAYSISYNESNDEPIIFAILDGQIGTCGRCHGKCHAITGQGLDASGEFPFLISCHSCVKELIDMLRGVMADEVIDDLEENNDAALAHSVELLQIMSN